MIIIDALNLFSEGGNGLLRYLRDELDARGVKYKVLELIDSEDHRRKYLFSFYRKKILKEAIKTHQPSLILSFGNFPLNIKIPKDVKVIVNFQNAFLLDACDTTHYSIRERLSFWVRRKYLNWYKKNAHLFVFPTNYIKDEFVKTYRIEEEKCLVIPYYDKPAILAIGEKYKNVKKEKDTFIYISSCSKHKNHLTLLAAWEVLAAQQLFPKLTISIMPEKVCSEVILKRVEEVRKKGAQIINVNEKGYIPYSKILEITAQHEFTIFPSLNETFGFGTIEGVILGNKLLVSDRLFVKEVTVPSLTFDPLQIEDIVEKVKTALKQDLPPSQVIFADKVDELLDLLTRPDIPSYTTDNV